MKIIYITTVPHKEQRYNTIGDYVTNNKVTGISISNLGDWRYEFLVAVHELIEWGLCRHAGISEKTIDKFDFKYKGNGEPGDESNAPYRVQHCIATGIERILAAAIRVDWKKYEDKINEICSSK